MESFPKSRLLLIDDHREILRALKLSLEIEGYEVRCAETLSEAEILLMSESFDLVICDYLLPEMNGIQFRAKLDLQIMTPPFLFCSGLATDNLQEPFLAKPFLVSDLICKMNDLLPSAHV